MRARSLLNIGNLIGKVFFSPAEGLSRVARQQPIGWTIGFIVGITFVYAIVAWTPETVSQVGYALWYFLDTPWKAALTSTFVVLLLTLISSAALHWISWLFGGNGSYPELLSALGFAYVPPGLSQTLLVALTKNMGGPGEVLRVVGGIWIFIWSVILGVLAVREAHGLSTLQAVAVHAVFVGIIIGLVILWAIAPIFALVGALLTVITLALWPSAFGGR